MSAVGYSLVIIVPTGEVLAGAAAAREQLAASNTNTTQFSMVLVALILVLGIAATILLANGLVEPLSRLTETAQEITAGDLNARAPVGAADEIGILARTINTMADNVRGLVQGLEERVTDRTAALATASAEAMRRAAQFEAITRVTAAIGSIRDLDALMPLVSSVISEQFGYYHVGIFINDEPGLATHLIAANSEGGHRMLDRRHNLKIGEQGIVGFVAARGEPRVAHRVGEDAIFFDNPDLPLTKAEAALPLRSGDVTIGVLDVQSTEEQAFSPDDLRILGVLADQVSLAFESARLYDATRRSLAETETLYRQYLRGAWQIIRGQGQITGYRSTPGGVLPLGADEGQNDDAESGSFLKIPIKLRDETIGEIAIRRADKSPITPEQMELVQAVAERVGLSAENARLFEETGRRAERERLVTEITAKIRRSNDPREMMQIALEELKLALGASDVQVIPQTVKEPQTRSGQAPSSPETGFPIPQGGGKQQ